MRDLKLDLLFNLSGHTDLSRHVRHREDSQQRSRPSRSINGGSRRATCSLSSNPSILSRFNGPRSSTERTRVSKDETDILSHLLSSSVFQESGYHCDCSGNQTQSRAPGALRPKGFSPGSPKADRRKNSYKTATESGFPGKFDALSRRCYHVDVSGAADLSDHLLHVAEQESS